MASNRRKDSASSSGRRGTAAIHRRKDARRISAGEVACTGVHGANRLAGNSLAQSCVFGHRAALAIAAERELKRPRPVTDPEAPLLAESGPSGPALERLRHELRTAMTDGAGPLRDAASLARAEAALQRAEQALGPAPHADHDALELTSMVTVGKLIVGSARLREESRGVHWRADHPDTEPAWAGRRLRVARTAADDV